MSRIALLYVPARLRTQRPSRGPTDPRASVDHRGTLITLSAPRGAPARAVDAKRSQTISSFPPYRTTSFSFPPHHTITSHRASPSQRIISQGVHCLATMLVARAKAAPAHTHSFASLHNRAIPPFSVCTHLHSRRRARIMCFRHAVFALVTTQHHITPHHTSPTSTTH